MDDKLKQAIDRRMAGAALPEASKARILQAVTGGKERRRMKTKRRMILVAAAVLLLITGNPGIHFFYHHRVDQREYQLDTAELMRILDGAPLDAPEITAFIRDFLVENESELYGGS